MGFYKNNGIIFDIKLFIFDSDKLKEIMNGIAVIVANQADQKEEQATLASRVQQLEHNKVTAHELSDNEDSCNESALEDNEYQAQEYSDQEQEVQSAELNMDHFLSPNHTQSDDNSMDELLQDYEEEKETSSKVTSKLAEFIGIPFRNGITEETFKKLIT